MKILTLTLSNIYQPRDGAALTVYNRWRRLGKKHQVVMVIAEQMKLPPDPGIIPPEEYCEAVYVPPLVPQNPTARIIRKLKCMAPWICPMVGSVINPEVKKLVHQLIRENQFDLIQTESLAMFWLLPKNLRVPIAYMCIDVASRFMKDKVDNARTGMDKFWAMKQYAHVRSAELREWLKPKVIFTLTATEKNMVQQVAPNMPIFVTPNSADLDFLIPKEAPAEQGEIMLIGALGIFQMEDASEWMALEVLPLVRQRIPHAKLTLVGKRPGKRVLALKDVPGVNLVGEVEDIRPYLNRAHVVAAPVRCGAGMKGKTVEGMAMKKPVVAHSISADGLDCESGKHLIIADTTEDFAQAIVNIMEDEHLAKRLGENGRKLVEEKYSWDSVVELIDSVYQKIEAGEPLC